MIQFLCFGEVLFDGLPTGPEPGGAPLNVVLQGMGVSVYRRSDLYANLFFDLGIFDDFGFPEVFVLRPVRALHLMGHLPKLFLHKAPKEVEAQNDQDIESGIDVK